MKEELKIFLTALMFYTRIPLPISINYNENYLNKATKYFPLIGWIVGFGAAFSVYLLHFVLPISVCVILSFILSILITGAFHEDGFADVCDGFGGGWTKEKILDIMKDSRIGAYGVVGLVLLFSLKISATINLLSNNFFFGLKTIVFAHVFSRFITSTIVYTHNYSREDTTSKVKPIAKNISLSDLLFSLIFVIPAFLLFQNYWIFLIIIPTYLMKIYLASYFTKWIDGYTGDCLGATQQIIEVLIYILMLILIKINFL